MNAYIDLMYFASMNSMPSF